MGSSLFSQALNMVPMTNVRFSPSKLGFSPSISRHPFSFRSNAVTVSRAPHNSVKIFESNRKNFAILAESGSAKAASDSAVASEEFPQEAEAEPSESESAVAVESEKKPEFKPRAKLGDIMGILNNRAIEAMDEQRQTPDIRVGDIVQIKMEVPENRRRLSVYKGIVMTRQNAGIHTTIRIRNIIAGVGVEIIFPLYSPNIKEIAVVKHRKVRRARLYYLRDKLPRLSTFK